MKRGYPGAGGPETYDHLSTRPAIGVHQADRVHKWPSTGKVSPPNAPELKSTREGVGTNAVAVRKAPGPRQGPVDFGGRKGEAPLMGSIEGPRSRSLGRRT